MLSMNIVCEFVKIKKIGVEYKIFCKMRRKFLFWVFYFPDESFCSLYSIFQHKSLLYSAIYRPWSVGTGDVHSTSSVAVHPAWVCNMFDKQFQERNVCVQALQKPVFAGDLYSRENLHAIFS